MSATATSRKGWRPATLERLGVGFEANRFVFTILARGGDVCGVVRYRDHDGPGQKMYADAGTVRELWPRPEDVPGSTLYVDEGEPDAVSMAELGLPAVSLPGAGKASKEWPARLAAHRERVVFVCDADSVGRLRMRKMAERVAALGVEAVVVDPAPTRDDGYDLGDMLADAIAAWGDDGREYVRRWLEAEAEAAEPVEPEAEPSSARLPRKRTLVLTPASAIRSERGRWLWCQRFPLRGLTVVAGEKGLGKSILTNAQTVAAITRGTLDGELSGTPADVLIVTAEDDWRSVVKPRLMACGADLDRVHRIEVHDADGVSLLTLPDDVADLEAAITKLRAAGRIVAMLVVDPIGAFVPETANTHADAPVRRILAPLAALADRQDLAVIAVAHLTKDESKRLISRVSGSGAFVNAARSVLAMVRDPDDPEGEQGAQRLIVHVASNWGRYAPTLAAHVEGRDVDTDDGERTSVGYLVIDGESSATVDDVQRGRDDDAGDAEEAIGGTLAGGPRPSLEVKARVMEELGCSRRTVERAAERMAERGELAIEAGGYPRKTTWRLARAHEGGFRDATERNDAVEPNPPVATAGNHGATDATGQNDGVEPKTEPETLSRDSGATLVRAHARGEAESNGTAPDLMGALEQGRLIEKPDPAGERDFSNWMRHEPATPAEADDREDWRQR